MAVDTKIQWAHHTFNAWRGCTKVSAGCANCYAESNYSVKMHGVKWGPHGTRVRLSDAGWKQPLKWNRDAAKAGERRRVFSASLADVFEDWTGPVLDVHGRQLFRSTLNGLEYDFTSPPERRFNNDRATTLDDLRRDLFALIDRTPHLDWLLLTKRPENIRRMTPVWTGAADDIGGDGQTHSMYRSNVWLGTSIEDQASADERIPKLLECRDLAPVLFLSVEPLLGLVDLIMSLSMAASDDAWIEAHEWGGDCELCGGEGFREYNDAPDEWGEDCPSEINHLIPCRGCAELEREKRLRVIRNETGKGLWVIVGGESGPKARPCDTGWCISLMQQCNSAGVRFFLKQLGANPVQVPGDVDWSAVDRGIIPDPVPVSLRDPKGGDPSEWSDDLQVREVPDMSAASN